MQMAGRAIQTQLPADKREAIGKTIEADAKKYVDEAYPPVRERALKLAPTTLGAALEEKFTEDELKQLIAWLESPVNKKFQRPAARCRATSCRSWWPRPGRCSNRSCRRWSRRCAPRSGAPAAGASADGAAAPKAAAKPPAKAAGN